MVETRTRSIEEGTKYDTYITTWADPEGGGRVIAFKTEGKGFFNSSYEQIWFCGSKINDDLLTGIIMKGKDEALKHGISVLYTEENKITGLLDDKDNILCELLAEIYRPPGHYDIKPHVIYITSK
jgi:hypothetical protein